MRRIASHYIYWKQWFRMHYIELNAEGQLIGVFPLDQEIAGTEFYDGTLLLLPVGSDSPSDIFISRAKWLNKTETVSVGDQVLIYRLTCFTPATSELGTDNGCGDCHVQRL